MGILGIHFSWTRNDQVVSKELKNDYSPKCPHRLFDFLGRGGPNGWVISDCQGFKTIFICCICDFFVSFDARFILPPLKAERSVCQSDYVNWCLLCLS